MKKSHNKAKHYRFARTRFARQGDIVQDVDDEFYNRADEHINLSNEQMSDEVGRGKVSASFMYSVARFNAYVSATGWDSKQEMIDAKEETLEYFVSEYKKMLEENIDDYIENFETYMGKSESET